MFPNLLNVFEKQFTWSQQRSQNFKEMFTLHKHPVHKSQVFFNSSWSHLSSLFVTHSESVLVKNLFKKLKFNPSEKTIPPT